LNCLLFDRFVAARLVSKDRKMALLRAAKDQLLAGKAAPWLHAGLRNVCRSFAAQAEPLEDEEGVYVVT
jgi:hypothetical protein